MPSLFCLILLICFFSSQFWAFRWDSHRICGSHGKNYWKYMLSFLPALRGICGAFFCTIVLNVSCTMYSFISCILLVLIKWCNLSTHGCYFKGVSFQDFTDLCYSKVYTGRSCNHHVPVCSDINCQLWHAKQSFVTVGSNKSCYWLCLFSSHWK